MKIVLNLAIAFLLCNALQAQIEFIERIEFEIKDGFVDESFFEMGKNGVLIRSVSKDDTDGMNEIKFRLYNTDLEEDWSESSFLNKKFRHDETTSTVTSLHSTYRNKKGDFKIISVESDTREVTEVSGSFPKKTYVSDMAILGDYAFFRARLKKDPYLFSVNWRTGKQKLIPIQLNFKSKSLALQNFQVLEESNEVFLYIKAIVKNKSEMYVLRLDEKGEKQDQYNLTENIDKNLVEVSARKLPDGAYIFTGTYGTKSTSSSEGLFFCKADKSNIEFIEYYNFLDLKEFLTYLPERKQEKLEKKKKRKEKKGKELKIKYYIADHEVMVLKDGYLFLGEAYYPTYRSEAYTTTVNGQTVTRYRTVFDGYQYTHAVVAKFDFKGIMQWDQTFTMWPSYKPYSVKRFISTPETMNEALSMVFSSYNRIVSKTINFEGEIIEDEESEDIELDKDGDEAKSSFSTLDYWYDDYFFAYGYQKIKNKQELKKKDRKRKVYFMSKIKY